MPLKLQTIFFTVALLTSSTIIRAQNDNFMLWSDYNLVIVKNSFLFGGDVGVRGLLTDPGFNQFVFRPTMWYKANPTFTFGAGAGLFSSILSNGFNYHEFRLQQEVTAKWPNFSWGSMITRLRIDERYFFYNNEVGGNEFNGRIRPMIGIKTKAFDIFNCEKPIYFQTHWEGFQNFDEAAITEILVNNTRLYLSFGQQISKGFKYEIHYIWQQSGLFNDFGINTQQHIIRLRIFHIIQ